MNLILIDNTLWNKNNSRKLGEKWYGKNCELLVDKSTSSSHIETTSLEDFNTYSELKEEEIKQAN